MGMPACRRLDGMKAEGGAPSFSISTVAWLVPIIALSDSGNVVIEQPTTGEEGGLFVSDPAADDT